MSFRARGALSITALFLAGAVSAVAQQPAAGDWSQWRGPDRAGLSRETGLLKQWPAGGPTQVWKAEGMGEGYGSVAVSGGRIYGMGYRGATEDVWAVDAATGRGLWTSSIGPAQRPVDRGDGPRSTPTVVGDALYVLGVHGELACLSTADGKIRWKKNLVRDFGGQVPHWGYSESPLVDGEKVIVAPGGRNATIVALNRTTGDVIWRSQVPEGDGAHYSSAIAANVHGQRQYIHFLARGVVGVDANDGRFLWRYSSPANNVANCSTPIFKDNMVFAASAYNTGGGLARLERTPNGVAPKEVYFTKYMKNHHGGMVLVGDYLYGFDESNLTCLDFKTGEVKWFNRSVGKGSVTYADGHIYARSERGPVALVAATPDSYQEKGRFDQPSRSSLPSWAYPVVAGGKLYLRDQDALLCYDVKPQ